MKQVLLQKGKIALEDVPRPMLEKGYVLVEVAYSVISVGTEVANVENSGKSLAKRAIEQPLLVKQVIEQICLQGLQKTISKVNGKIGAGTPLGYSCSGRVLQVASGVEGVLPGDLVACAGAGWASHAEIVAVPLNLITKIPNGCDLKSAASVTLGAIALQGVRRADPRLGEIVAVIGLGLLGQLTVQILVAAGCVVVGIDLDPKRVEIAKQLGAHFVFSSCDADIIKEIYHMSGNQGVDATIITASSGSDKIAQDAMEITRKKGKVVVVGAIGLGLKRSPFYEKEIDFLISCSYGPGRYDDSYERKGYDYPFSYVRWTEGRNMSEYLRLVADKKVVLGPIYEAEYDIDDVTKAFESLQSAGKPLAVVLKYKTFSANLLADNLSTKIEIKKPSHNSKVQIAVVGAGSFAKSVHLPNIKALQNLCHIRAIVSSTGHNASSTAKQFNADYCSTEFTDILDDSEVDAVILCTRHDLHANQVLLALKAGKHVFCEKPLALNNTELEEILYFYSEDTSEHGKKPLLTVGFNRRFSPAALRVKEMTEQRKNPLLIMYRVNAGYIPPDNWVQGIEGGGRILGEMCHMFDLFDYLVDSPPRSFSVETIHPNTEHVLASDNISTAISYEDGSLATLIYTSLGAAGLAKEYIEVHCDGKTFIIDDFKSLKIHGTKGKEWSSVIADKGHSNAISEFLSSLTSGSWPISLDSIARTTKLSIAVAQAVANPD